MLLYSPIKGIDKVIKMIELYMPHSSTANNQKLIKQMPVIRFGNTSLPGLDDNVTCFNRAESTYPLCNKREFIQGLNHAITLINDKDALKLKHITDIFYIGRGLNGRVKKVFNTYDEFIAHYKENSIKGWYYYIQPVQAKEYRAHCGHGKILLFYEKPIDSESEKDFRLIKQSEYNEFTVCLKNCLSLLSNYGLDFGVVDFSLSNASFIITDVNVITSFVTNTMVDKYAKYFIWLYNPERRAHFNYGNFKQGESLKWKNNQLLKPEIENFIEHAVKNGKYINTNQIKQQQVKMSIDEALRRGLINKRPVNEDDQRVPVPPQRKYIRKSEGLYGSTVGTIKGYSTSFKIIDVSDGNTIGSIWDEEVGKSGNTEFNPLPYNTDSITEKKKK